MLPGKRCVPEDLGAMFPDDFFKKHGDPNQFEQPESFWEAMEAALERFKLERN